MNKIREYDLMTLTFEASLVNMLAAKHQSHKDHAFTYIIIIIWFMKVESFGFSFFDDLNWEEGGNHFYWDITSLREKEWLICTCLDA